MVGTELILTDCGLIGGRSKLALTSRLTMALRTAFDDYLAFLTSNPVNRDGDDRKPSPVQGRMHPIRTTAERGECTTQFTRLVKRTKVQFAKDPDGEGDDRWRSSVQNVLRRARIYADTLDGAHSAEKLFQRFDAAFSRSEIITDTLAPLEFVEFSADGPFEFGTFRVMKFSELELRTIIENDTREIFWPDSTLDTPLLSQYWWLVVSGKRDPDYAGQLFEITEFLEGPVVERRYGNFPPDVERALKALVLFDWDFVGISYPGPRDIDRYLPDIQNNGWFGFNLPFVLRSGGSLYCPPPQAPDISRLSLDPVFDPDGVEYGVSPTRAIYPDSNSFFRTVTEFESQLNIVRAQTDRWQFIDVAVGYLVKAFFSDELDQLLWHITAIEALLGERRGGLTETLAQRCGLVLSSSKEDRKKIKNSFRNLYDIRSHIVHGNTNQPQAREGHLAIARNIARDAVVWFLRYLCFLADDIPAHDERHPERPELLSALDMGKEERERLSYLLGRLPPSFPS